MYPYIISSEDDDMYQVIEHGEVTAHIVETIDGTRQTLYFLDGSERHFQDTDIHEVMQHAPSKTEFQMAWLWFEENGYHVLADEGNGSMVAEFSNTDGTDTIHVEMSKAEIEHRAQLWRESRG